MSRVHPPPAGWAGQRSPRWPVAVLVGVVLLAILDAVWAYVSGEPATGLLFTAGAVYTGHVLGLGLAGRRIARRAGRPAKLESLDGRTTAVVFKYSGWVYYWLLSVLTLTILALLVFAALYAGTMSASGFFVAAIAAILAALIGWFTVAVLRLIPGLVAVSPDGVFHRGLCFTHFVPWYAVFAVTTEWVGGPLIVVKAAPLDGTRLRRLTGRFGTRELRFVPFLVVNARWLGSDPALVYRVLDFYYANPDRRDELGSTAALDRINSAMSR